MATKYNLKSRVNGLPQVEFVVYLWKKGKIDLTPKERSFVEKYLDRFSAKGDVGEKHVVSFPYNGHPRTIYLVGLGEQPTMDTIRRGLAAAVQFAKQSAIRDISVVVPEEIKDGFELGVVLTEGVELGSYVFTKYLADLAKIEKERSLQNVDLYIPKGLTASVTRGMKAGKILSEATVLTRNLVNEPAKHNKPADLAEQARQLSRSSDGRIFTEVLDRKECEIRGMGAFLAVAQGSDDEPYFIHMVYQPLTKRPTTELPVVALVGKGITFDSGGLSLKPAESMETMKIDMAGAASVLGVFSVLEKLRPEVVVHGYIAACENMPSGSAIKPGDIVTTQSGKTIEIRNTDAEGRLTLADALLEAQKVKPDAIIDLATLTGACVVALGEDVAGLFSNNKELANELTAAAGKEGELVWELPLVNDYRDFIKSSVADVRNISVKRWGGAITAALFLQEFVTGKAWAHIDIAGPSYTEQMTNPVNPAGASGFATRTILRYLQNLKGKDSVGKE